MPDDKLKIKDKAAQEKRHWIRITRVCNNNCLFCLDKENQNGQIVPFNNVIKELKKGRKEKATRAILSGGEPTLHPQIVKIVREAKKLGYGHIQIISNGRMLASEDFVKKLKKAGLDEITLSLHSHLKKDFEKINQVKSSYLQAMRGLLNALKYNFIVSVDIVINKINYKTLKNTLNFFIKLGVSEFDLLQVVPFGNAWLNKEKVFYSPLKAKKYLNQVFELSKRRNKDLFIWTNRLPAIYLERYESLIQHPIKLKDEIKERKQEFKNYLKTGVFLPCFDRRCRYCFLRGFCQDFVEFKNKRILWSKKSPLCLNKNKKKKRTFFKFKENLDLYKFLDFYINYRYFVKSLRCRKCLYYYQCDGVQINEVRTNGFNILKPKKYG